MLRLLGDMKKPLATRVKQTLRLVRAVRDTSRVTIPKTMSKVFSFLKELHLFPKKILRPSFSMFEASQRKP